MANELTRRGFVAGTAAAPLLAGAAGAASPDPTTQVAADLARYIGFGGKQAGGAGDEACGAWLAHELETLGFAIERQIVSVPFFRPQRAELIAGDARAAVWPQPIVIPTGPDGIGGPLVRVDADGRSETRLDGAIALVDLPCARWSTALAKPIRAPIEAAFARGARAVAAITNGPTGRIVALNADGRRPMFAGPVALLAPADAAPFLAAAAGRGTARLHVAGTGGRRPAFNFVGRIDRGRGRWLAVSTPRSGWFDCGGERGPGIAAWLRLARWASAAVRDHDLAFICNTGHEYEYLGAAAALHAIAPPPAETRFWFHLGANVAARDWHDTAGAATPLPSADPQRYLSISPALLPAARRIFAGEPGLEVPVSSETLAAGELTEIIAAGYRPAAGIFGVHRFHHVAGDGADCVSAGLTSSAADAVRRLIGEVLAGSRIGWDWPRP